ncbi:MAG TPA: terpene synthase family protein [Myxococcota bacterium]|nr:terpene synthase family protein [Myxococcota bacterium]
MPHFTLRIVGLILFAHHLLASEISDDAAKRLGQMAKETISALALGYKECCNPNIDQTQALSITWVTNSSPKSVRRIKNGAFAGLIGRAHSRASAKELSDVLDFATWLFIYDDNVEKKDNRKEIETCHVQTMAIVDGSPIDEIDDTLSLGFRNIIERIHRNPHASQLWKARFRRDIEDYCKATLWELENRKQNQVPSLREYRENRPNTSGTKIMFDFIELIEGITIPQEIFDSEYFKRIRLLGANLVNWENDILSAPKEFSENQNHNLVFVHKTASDLSDQEAFQQASQDLSNDFEAFMRLSREIPASFGAHITVVEKYIKGIIEWAAAHHFWAITSRRYTSYW